MTVNLQARDDFDKGDIGYVIGHRVSKATGVQTLRGSSLVAALQEVKAGADGTSSDAWWSRWRGCSPRRIFAQSLNGGVPIIQAPMGFSTISLRGMTGEPTIAELQQFLSAAAKTTRPRGPIALVAAEPAPYTRACTYAVMGPSTALVIEAFRDPDEAKQWLTAQAKQ